MLKRLTFILLLLPFILILAHCSDDDSSTSPIDPPAGFSGIRLTDKLGNILSGDSLDWCFPESVTVVPQVGMRAEVPNKYAFYPAYPNPNTEPEKRDISIVYDLPAAGDVDLYIIDQTDSVVKTLVDEIQDAGRYLVTWDQRDNQGLVLDTGIYRCVFIAGDFECTGDIQIDVVGNFIKLYADLLNDTMRVSYDSPVKVGAILLRFGLDGTAGTPIFAPITSSMVSIVSSYPDSLKITILPDIGNFHVMPAGENHLLSIPVDGMMTLDSTDVSDSLGTTLPAIIFQ